MVFYSLSSFLEAAVAEDSCKLHQNLLPAWIQTTQPCDVNRSEFKRSEKQVFESARLSTRCAKSWTVLTSDGKPQKITAGTKVLKLKNGKILFYADGLVQEGKVDPEAFSGKPGCKKEEQVSKSAFIQEARMMISISKSMMGETNEQEFFDKIKEVENRLDELEKQAERNFEKQVQNWSEKIKEIRESSPVDRLSKIESLLSGSYNPKQQNDKTYLEITALVPLSENWFQSKPDLKKFYDQFWVKQNPFARLNYGQSGEVLTRDLNPNLPPEEDGFKHMVELLEKTQKHIQESNDSKLKDSPEALWLEKNLPALKNDKKHLVFFFKDAWSVDPQKSKWADFVGIDQHLGGIPTDGLMSVAIHESNMANDRFFPHDSHVDPGYTNALFSCIEEKGIAAFKQSPENIRMLMGINPDISILYSDLFLSLDLKQKKP